MAFEKYKAWGLFSDFYGTHVREIRTTASFTH